MDPMMMGGMGGGMGMGQPPMPGGGGGMDPAMLAMLLSGIGGGGDMGMGGMGGGMGPGQPSMEDGSMFAQGTGGTTPMSLPQQPIPDTAGLGGGMGGMDSSSLLQALMAMSQGGQPMSGQAPVGGMY
jgi:hypothetical protein